jgi:predicted PilT family ATPase
MTSIFVFGSNLAGDHRKGSALCARLHHGAAQGVGKGRTGSAYAIPTKDKNLRRLSLKYIEKYVTEFIEYAKANPELSFEVTKIGCGLAGYREFEIRPLFKEAPLNCRLPDWWRSNNVTES